MFSWFRGKKHVVVEPDQVWLDIDKKYDGIFQIIEKHRQKFQAVLLIANFADAEARILSEGRKRNIEPDSFDKNLLLSGIPQPVPVWITGMDRIRGPHTPNEKWDAARGISFLAVDRHPLPENDQTIFSFAESLPFQVSLTYFSSMDDPLIRLFCSENVSAWLKGELDGDECICHKMIGRSLQSAQLKIAKKVSRPQSTRSAEEWFRLNLDT